jgi:hypothetical protein
VCKRPSDHDRPSNSVWGKLARVKTDDLELRHLMARRRPRNGVAFPHPRGEKRWTVAGCVVPLVFTRTWGQSLPEPLSSK